MMSNQNLFYVSEYAPKQNLMQGGVIKEEPNPEEVLVTMIAYIEGGDVSLPNRRNILQGGTISKRKNIKQAF